MDHITTDPLLALPTRDVIGPWVLIGAICVRTRHPPQPPLDHSIDGLTNIAGIARVRENYPTASPQPLSAALTNCVAGRRLLSARIEPPAQNGDVWSALGHCFLMQDNLQDTYSAYQQALYYLLNPKAPKLWYGSGILYDRYGSLEHPKEAFTSVLRMDKDFDKAKRIHRNPPTPDASDARSWHSLGRRANMAGQKYQRAYGPYQQAVDRDGPNPTFCAALASSITTSTNSDTPSMPQPDLLVQHRRSLFQHHQFRRALDAHSRAIRINPYISMVRLELDSLDGHTNEPFDRNGPNPNFRCSIGVLYYNINQFQTRPRRPFSSQSH